jgi:hypothetical protein
MTALIKTTYVYAIHNMKLRPQFLQSINLLQIMQFFSKYHCVQLEDGFIWAQTCSSDCILTIKICVSWLLIINFARKMQQDGPNYVGNIFLVTSTCIKSNKNGTL